MHEYRASGGHARSSQSAQAARMKETDETLHQLAEEYPRLLEFIGDKAFSHRGMKYKFRPIGPKPWKLLGTYSLRGRPTSAKRMEVQLMRPLHG